VSDASPPQHRNDSEAPASRPAWAEINLAALERNLQRIQECVAPAAVLAVVKADAYGHGATDVAHALQDAGADWLGVALLEEALELRRAGIALPILLLGPLQTDQLDWVESFDLVPAVSSLEQIRLWSGWLCTRDNDRPRRIHLKIDTGMNRLGIPETEWTQAADLIRDLPRLRVEGLLSHFSEAEALSDERSREQETLFAQAVKFLSERISPRPTLLHIANSAAALHRPSSRGTLARAGLALYGLDPAGQDPNLEPVMSVRARIVQLRRLEPGAKVGYGGEWTATRSSLIGVVPVGYADGYSWRLGNRSSVLVGGQRSPVVGAVSMDMVSVDLTDTPAELGSTITLLGTDGSETVSAIELATLGVTMPYEVLCHFGLRLPRRVMRDGRELRVSSRFS